MKKFMFRFVNIIFVSLLFYQTSMAKSGIKNAVKDFQYAVTIEWDQKDKAFLLEQERILSQEIEKLLLAGESPENILREVVSLIPDARLQSDVNQAISLYSHNKMSREELVEFLSTQASSMEARGPSWSPVVKFLVGLGIFYVVFNLFLFTLYYWDTDPNYGQVDNPQKT